MLTCREVARRADAYLDSELGGWAGLRILVHLKFCLSCQRFIRQMKQTRSLVDQVSFEDESNGLDERIVGLLDKLAKHDEI